MLNDHAYTLNVGNQRIAQARRGVSYTNTVDLVNREYERANKLEQQVKYMKTRILRALLAATVFCVGANVAQAFYDPGTQRWVNRDPIGEEGGVNMYEFTKNSPPGGIDMLGLTLYKCTRGSIASSSSSTSGSGTSGGSSSGSSGGKSTSHALPQHVYLWDDTSKTGCGMGGGFITQKGVNNPGDNGPGTPGHTCTAIPNSSGKEAEVMKCCQGKKTHVWTPWNNDCHSFSGDCLEDSGLSNPEIYGRVYGPVDAYKDYCALNPNSILCKGIHIPWPKISIPGSQSQPPAD